MRTESGDPGLAARLSHMVSRARGVWIEDDLGPYHAVLDQVRAHDFGADTDRRLRERTQALRERVRGGAELPVLLPEMYALVAEAARRALDQSAFDEQIVAGVALASGRIAQMQTGEGKTLAVVFPAALHALTGRSVHVMTANDYLARRDAEWMGPVYRALGIQAAFIQEGMDMPNRRAGYAAEVTYVTAREAGFDLLRDGLRYRPEDILHRPLDLAIVDEADFILIDEARIPLVIASRSAGPDVDPRRIDGLVRRLEGELHFRVDRAGRRVHLTPAGQDRVRELLGCGEIHEEGTRDVYAAVTVALHAHHLLASDVDYIVRDGRIHLVDELTGRVAEGRRWPYGIQPALEAKEGLILQPEGVVHGTITIQHFLRLYRRLAGLTATAVPAAPEISRWYGLRTLVIPPRLPTARRDAPDRVYATRKAKMDAVVEEIRRIHATGRPLLVGTPSVRDSEILAARLRGMGVGIAVLNARNDRAEAALVARAGMLGALTISTNMAGRGTDIKLGGEQGIHRHRILELGGLYVLGTTRHESVRIDLQLRGRAGRQGDPGESRFLVSLEDPLVLRYAVTELLPARYRSTTGADADLITDPRVAREIARAQGIIDTQHQDMRRTLRRYTEIVESERAIVQEIRSRALVGILPEELTRCPDVPAGEDRELLRRCYLEALDKFWSDHLVYVDEVKEGAPLQRLGGEDPLLHFLRHVDDAFTEGLAGIARTARTRRDSLAREDAVPSVGGPAGPAGTWTYHVNDDPLPDFRVSMASAARTAASAAAMLVAIPLAMVAAVAALAAGLRRLVRRRNGDRGAPGP